MTTLDDRRTDVPCGWSVAFLVAVLDAREAECRVREIAAYAAGLADGERLGLRRAQADIEAEWSHLARGIRRGADRILVLVPTPVTRTQDDDLIWFAPHEHLADVINLDERRGRRS